MSVEDRSKWDSRYDAGEYATRTHPTDLLVQWMGRLPRGRALDLACGAGRNAIFLAGQGYQVDALDISQIALDRGAKRAEENGLVVNWICQDLDTPDIALDSYDLIFVARFLNRALFPLLVDGLRDGGCLVYETHLRTTARVGGPRGSHFRVRPGELLHLAHELRPFHYFEGIADERDGASMALAQIIGCKGTPAFESTST
ncbi:MAG: class I SAM-dependent methyltransferase [Chromatiales bacterium]|jgi:tellurite methyltransferase|nr:class I SAM-dependent methyltransferase [Chromatiales bacterium]